MMGMKIGENDRKEARKEGVHRIGPRSYAAISIFRALPSGFINLGREREEKNVRYVRRRVVLAVRIPSSERHAYS